MLTQIDQLLSLPTPVLGTFTAISLFFLYQGRNAYLYVTRRKRHKFLPKYAGKLHKMKEMDWKHFEFLCEELFKARGWKTRCDDIEGPDGGVDVWAKRAGEQTLIQCKRYKNTSVGVKVVRELFGLMASHEAQSGYIVTTSYFTKEAYRFAKGKRISLIDGIQLEKLTIRILHEKDKKNDLEAS